MISDARIRVAGLVPCDLPAPNVERVRQLYVTKEINDVIAGKSTTNPEFPSDEADLVLGRYTKGYIVGVSRTHKGRGDLKWLQNLDEVWVLAFRKPVPGWRLFGRFARKNVFIGLHLVPRELAGDTLQYAQQGQVMQDAWNLHFPDCEPFKRTEVSDYVGELWDDR